MAIQRRDPHGARSRRTQEAAHKHRLGHQHKHQHQKPCASSTRRPESYTTPRTRTRHQHAQIGPSKDRLHAQNALTPRGPVRLSMLRDRHTKGSQETSKPVPPNSPHSNPQNPKGHQDGTPLPRTPPPSPRRPSSAPSTPQPLPAREDRGQLMPTPGTQRHGHPTHDTKRWPRARSPHARASISTSARNPHTVSPTREGAAQDSTAKPRSILTRTRSPTPITPAHAQDGP